MVKKIIIAILILLILGSLGVIGYIVVSQNPNLKTGLTSIWPFGQKMTVIEPKVPVNFFPEASNVTTAVIPNTNPTSLTSTSSPDNFIDNNPSLAGASAVGLTLITKNKFN